MSIRVEPSYEGEPPQAGGTEGLPARRSADVPMTLVDRLPDEQTDRYGYDAADTVATVVGRVAQRGVRPRGGAPVPVEPEQYVAPAPAEQVHARRLEETPQRVDEASNQEADKLRRPDEHALAQRARTGSPMYRQFSWIDGTARVTGTPEALPTSAEVTTADRTNADAQEVVADPPMRWVRLRGEFASGTTTAPAPDTPKDGRTRLEELTERCRGTDFSVVVAAEGVPDSQRRQLLAGATRAQTNASNSGYDPDSASALVSAERDAQVYARAANGALVHETVVVGVRNPAELERVAEEAARLLVTGSSETARSLRFHVDRDERGLLRTYNSMEDAVTGQGSTARSVILSTQELADHLQLPDTPLPGLGRRNGATNLDVERIVRPGVETLEFAEILDNLGHPYPIPKPLLVTREHTTVIAETEAGKTAMLQGMGVAIMRKNFANYLRAKATGLELGEPDLEFEYEHEAVVYLDCKKQNQFTYSLSEMVGGIQSASGEQIPKEMATIHHAVLGGNGVGIRLNLLRPAEGVTAGEWRHSIDEAIETMSVKYKLHQGDIYHAVKKHLTETIDTACDLFGIDPQTGRSRFPNGPPATPTGEFISNLVEEVVDKSGLQGEYRNNVVGWVKTEIKQLFRGDNGSPLSAEGYDLDPMAVLDNKGITSIDLLNITDAGAQKVAALATLRSLYNACKQRNLAEGYLEEYKGVRMTVIIDEANFLDDPDVADFYTHARSQGLRFVAAKQGAIDASINEQVKINTPNKIMLRSTYKPDLDAFANAAGKTTYADVDNALSAADQGEGIYKGPGMPRAVRFRVYNPNDSVRMPRAPRSHVVGPEALVRPETTNMYDYELRKEARSLLTNDPFYVQVSNWAEKNIIQVACGRPMTDIAGELEAGIETRMASPYEGELVISEAQIDLEHRMFDPIERERVRCAISEAVLNAVNSRPDLQYVASRARYIELLETHMLARADGEYLEGWDTPRPELALNVATPNDKYKAGVKGDNGWKRFHVEIDGEFAAAKDRISEQRTAPALGPAVTSKYEAALDRPLEGVTAYEQRDVVVRHMIDAVNHIVDAIDGAAMGKPQTPEALTRAKEGISLLIGSEIVKTPEVLHLAEPDEIETIRARAVEFTVREIAVRNKVVLDPKNTAELRKLVDGMDISALGRRVSLRTVKRELDAQIQQQEERAEAVPAEELEALCGRAIGGRYAKDQWDTVERLEQAALARVPYATLVQPSRIFHPMDLLRPGSTIDNNLAVLQRSQTDGGPLSMSVNRKQNKPAEADLTFGGQLQHGDYSGWRKFMARHFLYSTNFVDSPAVRRFMALRMGRITTRLAEANRPTGQNVGVGQRKAA